MAWRLVIPGVALAVALSHAAAAQIAEPTFEASGTFVTTGSAQFHTRDIGIGGRLGWRINPLLGIEGELTYHADPFSDGTSFSAGRLEGLFGATVGPRLDKLRPFAAVRPGFVRYRGADEPFTCIATFPPPLSCTLAAGRTVFALDLGGGVEFSPSARTVFRTMLTDRMVRYPAPVFDTGGQLRDDSFASHDVRFALDAGFRF
jgi:hypothetical protein